MFNGGPKGVEMHAILLTPTAITKDNLNLVIDAGWITKDAACKGVAAGTRRGLRLAAGSKSRYVSWPRRRAIRRRGIR